MWTTITLFDAEKKKKIKSKIVDNCSHSVVQNNLQEKGATFLTLFEEQNQEPSGIKVIYYSATIISEITKELRNLQGLQGNNCLDMSFLGYRLRQVCHN